MKLPVYLVGPLFFLSATARTWTVRIEEPTGIYAREAEVVRVPLAKLAGPGHNYQVTDVSGEPVPFEQNTKELAFPVTLIPGETPEFQVHDRAAPTASRDIAPPLVRRLGTQRLELANSRFRIVVDLSRAAIVEAYSRTAGRSQALNFVETTPDAIDPNDIHVDTAKPLRPMGPNPGWTTLFGRGRFEETEILQAGPWTAHVRLSRSDEQWDFQFTANSAGLKWTVTGTNSARRSTGFRFSSISALPYLPFNRFVDGDESRWPSGPGSGEPPGVSIGIRPWKRPPGGHFAYYRNEANYGALGIVELDDNLQWTGAGTRRVQASHPAATSAIALTFPVWKASDTALEARKEARILRQPLLVEVIDRVPQALLKDHPGVRSLLPSLLLDGDWELAWGEKGAGPTSEWRTVRVPGTAHVQWLPAADLYTPRAAWVSSKEWWYRRKFRVPESFSNGRLWLQFDATDYYAEVWLDGVRIGRHEGYIDPYEYDVSDRFKPGKEHEIRIRVWTPVHYYWRHRPYTIKGSYGGVDQKPDDITALGITRSVRLVARGNDRIGSIAVDSRVGAGPKDPARLTVSIETVMPSTRCHLTLRPHTFNGEAITSEGLCGHQTLIIPEPRLWWTWDQGRPDLYTLEVRLSSGSDAARVTVGLREIERIGDQFYLNHRRLFLRGTNSYYHLFLSEMTPELHARDFALIRRLNVNAIRLHCHFSNPEFYELADEQGVLIWQDFLEAWYPRDTRFSVRAASLYDNHILYVRNHPSVFAWAPSDEEDLENYRDLSKHLAARPALLDPQHRPVIRSTGRWQDAHLYYGWYGGSIWQYAQIDENLVTELGATSLPAPESIRRFLPGKWPFTAYPDDWRFHKLQIEEAITAWGSPRGISLDGYVPRTQAYAARLFQVAIERVRRRKQEGAGGIFHFFAIDIWPSITMAAYDFYRVPTAVVDTVRRSFEPILASIEYSTDQVSPSTTVEFPLWAINDRHQPFEGEIIWSGGRYEVHLPPDSSMRIGTLKWKTAGTGPQQLKLQVRSTGGETVSENLYYFNLRR